MKFDQNLDKVVSGRTSGLGLLICIFTLLIFCLPAYSQTPAELSQISAPGNYVIGVGDTLRVLVTRHNELSMNNIRVNYDGNIRIPMMDEEIPAACLTERELAALISKKYERFLHKPQVYVMVEGFNSNPVAFIGAVNSPSRFELRRPTRLLELLAQVNGPAKNAGNNIQIIRRPDFEQCVDKRLVRPDSFSDTEIIFVPLDQTLKGENAANPYVQAGDIITIAEAEAPNTLYIIGNVRAPREISFIEPITLTKVIAMAGGASKGAKIKEIKIRRQDPDSSIQATTLIVNLKDINEGKQDDIFLQPNDIIDVPGPKPSILSKILGPIIRTGTRGLAPVPILIP